jgi:hypothetical protein
VYLYIYCFEIVLCPKSEPMTYFFNFFSSKECDLIHGECVQTYIPYLFLVIPLGPVTLTGQDYVLVKDEIKINLLISEKAQSLYILWYD